ncbi:MAG: tetratricopeptide repeat protein [Gammaproteobacteria bacterium]|jgi:tetratricopeptide (TPR) repeat protein|nr:tetratricopeptide repeat protein [Gammaproteobacteria bacterium]
MPYDLRETPISATTPDVINRYEKALEQFQSYVGDPVETIENALDQDPEFVLGHLFRAIVLMMFGEQRFVPDAQSSLEAAEALSRKANDREHLLTMAANRLIAGDWDGACHVFDRVLVDYPRDAFTVQAAHLMDFYRGDALNLRNRISRVMPHWSPSVPGYSYLLGMHAFGLEECNQYADAERAARRALDLQPKDGWAVHAGVHVMEMQGRIDEGIEWLESRAQDWAPDNGFAFHNWWHLALYYLDRQRNDRVLSVYDREIAPESPEFILTLVDATAMLWRLYLLGVDSGDRFEALALNWEQRLDTERGFYAFNDLHAMMAFAATGRSGAARRLLGDMQATVETGQGINVMMTREVGIPLCRAVQAFSRGRYRDAVELIAPVRDTANRFGGSHAQRDVISLTLIEAALRDGQSNLARHFIAERTVHKPGSGLGWRLLGRTGEAPGRREALVRDAA